MTSLAIASVIVVSDRCSRGEETDRSGPHLAAGLTHAGMDVLPVSVVPDQVPVIQSAIKKSLDVGARVLLVAGGTGVSPQDVTPEATEPLIEVDLPGVTQALYQASLAETPYAALSRGQAGLTKAPGRALLITLPGSINAGETTLRVLTPLLGHLLSQLDRNPKEEGAYVDH